MAKRRTRPKRRIVRRTRTKTTTKRSRSINVSISGLGAAAIMGSKLLSATDQVLPKLAKLDIAGAATALANNFQAMLSNPIDSFVKPVGVAMAPKLIRKYTGISTRIVKIGPLDINL